MKRLNKYWSRTETERNSHEFRNYNRDSRPHKVKNSQYMIDKLFYEHFFKESESKFDIRIFITDLINHEQYLMVMYKYFLKEDKDFRTGYETYGYASEESIINNLCYINSKWKCSFRIRWLIDLIKLSKVLRYCERDKDK